MHSEDKRRHARAAIRGVARVGDSSELVAVRDASAGGLGLLGGPVIPVGSKVGIEFRLFGQAAVAFGHVAWTVPGPHPAMGVLLERTSDLDELIGDLESHLTRRRPRGTALLVESEPSRAALLGEYLWSHGYEVEEMPAPLHAIERLTRGGVEMVAIGPHLSTCSGGEFASFVAENFPRVHRLVVAHIAHGTGSHTVAAAYEVERPAQSMSAVVCDDFGGKNRS